MGKRAQSVSSFYRCVTSCKKSKKSLEPFLRKTVTDRQTNNSSRSSTEVENCNVVKRLAQRQSCHLDPMKSSSIAFLTCKVTPVDEENFSLFPLKTADLETVGSFYPALCTIGLSLCLSSINPILYGLFSGFFRFFARMFPTIRVRNAHGRFSGKILVLELFTKTCFLRF